MKHIILLLLMLAGIGQVHAQDTVVKRKEVFINKNKCSKAYFGVSTGFNNPNGILGFNLAVPVNLVVISAGVGVSTWGNKIYGEGRYFLKPCQHGFAFAAGITHDAGRVHAQLKMQTDQGNHQQVTMNLNPVTNGYVAVYHFWQLGKRHNRFFTDLGYSVPFETAHFKQVFPPGPPPQNGFITQSAKDKLREFSPGGMMIGAGFCFGLQ